MSLHASSEQKVGYKIMKVQISDTVFDNKLLLNFSILKNPDIPKEISDCCLFEICTYCGATADQTKHRCLFLFPKVQIEFFDARMCCMDCKV